MGITYTFADGKRIKVLRALGDRVAYLTERGQVYPGDPIYGEYIDAIEQQRKVARRARFGESEHDQGAPR
ncbi:MAG: hypothetical protein OXJ54_17060 [Gemmatimonadetes bacterium]|nr:hypothetical protein [Candidatus Palauibacter rhopaloidicola]